MGRDYVYLGKTVRDTGQEGLDSLREVRDIADAIIDNCVSGRISYRKAMSQMNLLELVVTKSKKLKAKGLTSKARAIVDKKREELMEECGEKE